MSTPPPPRAWLCCTLKWMTTLVILKLDESMLSNFVQECMLQVLWEIYLLIAIQFGCIGDWHLQIRFTLGYTGNASPCSRATFNSMPIVYCYGYHNISKLVCRIIEVLQSHSSQMATSKTLYSCIILLVARGDGFTSWEEYRTLCRSSICLTIIGQSSFV